MKRMVIPSFVLLFSLQALAQDVLTMRSGAKYEVKLLEITDHELRFKMFNNPEGPLYTISRSSFYSVRYQNGATEEFALQAPGDKQTVSVNGYNVSATNDSSDQPVTAGVADDNELSTQQVSISGKRAVIGQVAGALFNTGLLVLDIATELQAARKIARNQRQSHCSSH